MWLLVCWFGCSSDCWSVGVVVGVVVGFVGLIIGFVGWVFGCMVVRTNDLVWGGVVGFAFYGTISYEDVVGDLSVVVIGMTVRLVIVVDVALVGSVIVSVVIFSWLPDCCQGGSCGSLWDY